MTERTEVCLQKSVCAEKCLEDRRWLAGNMQASPPWIILQTSISHWFDFILRVRTALLITANSCNSVVVPDKQSSSFPTKTISDVLWKEMTTPVLRHPGLRSFCSSPGINGASSKPIPLVCSQQHPCHHPWAAGKLLQCWRSSWSPPQPAWVGLCPVLGEMWCGTGRAGDRTASWALIQAITPVWVGQQGSPCPWLCLPAPPASKFDNNFL